MAVTKKQIRYIQSLRRRLGIDDDLYLEMKKSVGASSTTELTGGQFDELVKRIESHGGERSWKPLHKSAKKSGMDKAPPEEKEAVLRKIEAILADMKLPWSYADGMAKRMFGVSLLKWCDAEQTYKIMQALCVYQERRGAKQ